MNFYGVKSDIPSTQIKVEQSQADRSKKEFAPVKLDLNQKGIVCPMLFLCEHLSLVVNKYSKNYLTS